MAIQIKLRDKYTDNTPYKKTGGKPSPGQQKNRKNNTKVPYKFYTEGWGPDQMKPRKR